nr:hypothetical protein [Herbidospora sakaeratensis]
MITWVIVSVSALAVLALTTRAAWARAAVVAGLLSLAGALVFADRIGGGR